MATKGSRGVGPGLTIFEAMQEYCPDEWADVGGVDAQVVQPRLLKDGRNGVPDGVADYAEALCHQMLGLT